MPLQLYYALKSLFFFLLHLQLVNSIAKTYVGTNAYMAVSRLKKKKNKQIPRICEGSPLAAAVGFPVASTSHPV